MVNVGVGKKSDPIRNPTNPILFDPKNRISDPIFLSGADADRVPVKTDTDTDQ